MWKSKSKLLVPDMLLTTTVGSFPKPAYLVKARNEFASGELSQEELTQLEKKATEECIHPLLRGTLTPQLMTYI